jgi:hypothetical protein
MKTENARCGAVKRRSWWSSLPPWQRWAAAAGAAGVLLLGVVLLVRTPHGTIEIELSDPKENVTVTVDGDTINVARLDEPLSLEVGSHELKVKGAGYEAITKQFKVTRGKNTPLTVTLLPPRPVRPASTPEDRCLSMHASSLDFLELLLMFVGAAYFIGSRRPRSRLQVASDQAFDPGFKARLFIDSVLALSPIAIWFWRVAS